MDALAVLPMSTKSKNNDNTDFLDKELRTLTPGYLGNFLGSLQRAYGCEVQVDILAGQATAILFLKAMRGEEHQANDAEWWQGDARLSCLLEL